MVPPKEGERAKRVRLVFLMCGEYGEDGLTARVLAVWMGRLVALAGFPGGASADSGTLQKRQADAFAGTLLVLETLAPDARVVAATGWLSLMEVEPKGRLAVAMLGAAGSRHPCRVRWSEEVGDWVEAGADLAVPAADSRPLGALAAFALGQHETVYQRALDSRGLPPRWSADDEQGRQAWDDAERLARSTAALINLAESDRARLIQETGSEREVDASVAFAKDLAGVPLSEPERSALESLEPVGSPSGWALLQALVAGGVERVHGEGQG